MFAEEYYEKQAQKAKANLDLQVQMHQFAVTSLLEQFSLADQ